MTTITDYFGVDVSLLKIEYDVEIDCILYLDNILVITRKRNLPEFLRLVNDKKITNVKQFITYRKKVIKHGLPSLYNFVKLFRSIFSSHDQLRKLPYCKRLEFLSIIISDCELCNDESVILTQLHSFNMTDNEFRIVNTHQLCFTKSILDSSLFDKKYENCQLLKKDAYKIINDIIEHWKFYMKANILSVLKEPHLMN